jgi:hypothetical protein
VGAKYRLRLFDQSVGSKLSVMAGLTYNVENEGTNCQNGIDGPIVVS